jgi:hypothetical protein
LVYLSPKTEICELGWIRTAAVDQNGDLGINRDTQVVECEIG